MFAQNVLLLGVIAAFVAAAPVKRDVVWYTETEWDVVTVPITTTVWVGADGSVPTAQVTQDNFGPGPFTSPASPTSAAAPYTPATVAASSPTSTAAPVVATSQDTPAAYTPPTTSTWVYTPPATTSTSVYVAPTTSTTPEAATTTTPTTTTINAASNTGSGAVAPGATYSGDITWYDVGQGSCGWTNSDSDAIVAIPHGMMNNGINPNNNPLCGQYITISYGGVTTQAKIVDTCGGCDGQAIDLSPAVFNQFAAPGAGRVHNVNWWLSE